MLSSDHAKSDRKADLFVLLGLLVASLALNVYLAVNKARVTYSLTSSQIAAVQTGSAVAPFEVTDQSGSRMKFEFSSESLPMVLYMFSPHCRWCDYNYHAIVALSKTQSAQYRFIGVSLSDTDLHEYMQTHPLPFPVYQGVTLETAINLRLGVTPQLIIVSPQGRVVRNWLGTLDSHDEELRKQFGVGRDQLQ